MARQDIGYDYEDFGMSAEELKTKYSGLARTLNPDEHPEYIRQQYYDMVREDPEGPHSHLEYWDWVSHMISMDDDSIEGQPESAPAPANTIETLDQFAAVIARWHINGMKQAEHMLEMPEGYVTEYVAKEGDKPIQIELKGDLLIAFRMGVMTGVDAFGALPFTYSLDEAAVEPEQEDGTASSN